MPDPLAGVILAGGASRRMGRDKACLPCPGTPGLTMVEHTVAVVARRCAPVFVIAAPEQTLPPVDATVLRDEVVGMGPLLATGRGLRAAAAVGRERAFVSAVDMPNLSADLIDELNELADADVVLPWDGRDHYLAGIYRTSLAARIDVLIAAGERSMRALTDSVRTRRVEMADRGGVSPLVNLNRPSDLG